MQGTVVSSGIARPRSGGTRLLLLTLPLLISVALVGTLFDRSGRAVAQDDPPPSTGTIGFIDAVRDRYLLVSLDQALPNYGAFLVAIPGVGFLSPTAAPQVTTIAPGQIALAFNGPGVRDASAIIDAEVPLNSRASGQAVPVTFQVAATLDPVRHVGSVQVTYNGQTYALDFVAPPLTADATVAQIAAAVQAQDAIQLYALADRQVRGAFTQAAFASWFNGDFAALGTITAVATLRGSLYTVEQYGYHSASAVIAVTAQAGGTRWIEVLLINDGGNWRLHTFAPLPLDKLAVVAGGPYTVAEGQAVAVAATAFNPANAALTFAWDLDNDGSFETNGQSVTFSAASLDGPATRTIRVRATAAGGAVATGQTTVTVTNVAPTATFVAPGLVALGSTFTIRLNSPQDVAADRPTLQYAFDCGGGAGYGPFGATSSRACAAPLVGVTRTVRGIVRDKDGGETAYSATITLIAGLP